jgi:hypothetical protein
MPHGTFTPISRPQLAMLAVAFAVSLGCGDRGYGDLNLIGVTGAVTLDGNPLPGARVRFEGTDGAGAEGITDAAGKYRLMYDSDHPGCTPGVKKVRITLAGAVEEGVDPDAVSGDEGNTAGETLPAVYNSQTTLSAEVSSTNRNFDFPLKSNPAER